MSKLPKSPIPPVPSTNLPLDAYEHPAATLFRESGDPFAIMAHDLRWLMVGLQRDKGHFLVNVVHASSEEWQRMDLMAKLPVVAQVPANRACLRLFNEINSCIPAGSFMLDQEDGAMFFRHGCHYEVDDSAMRGLATEIRYVLWVLNDWLPTITAVAYGWRTVEAALADYSGTAGPN